MAAIRRLFDWLVVGRVVSWNPAATVRGPTHIVKRGKTPVLRPDEVRLLLDSIDTSAVGGLRDRALLGVMIYSFARVTAVVNMNIDDYHQQGKRWWLRLREKGGKEHALPAYHRGGAVPRRVPGGRGDRGRERARRSWRSLTRTRELGDRRMSRVDVFLDGQAAPHGRRAGRRGQLPHPSAPRASTAARSNASRRSPGHERPRTTQLYDRDGR